MKLRYDMLALVVAVSVIGPIAWRSGWSAHADHVNALAAKKKENAEKAIQPEEEKAAAATAEGKVIYRTITRDVVKYVQSPDRTVCQFDDAAVQLRQRAIDAANSISGFDAGAVPGK
ncbi:hypothetical protein FJT49_18345 [Escherichia coli]|uniref:hypothetical protein n=1 Tax=Escherichia coli TaxID=562 RepID=UPI000BB49E57|nr:hypothetical protein [Escherichia coli]EEY7913646.1 hypothetical protein [Escherichia coli O21:H28]EEZ5806292.1 hypothetical protein [Escherichia coli O105]ATB82714.1 hypothetical protein CNQ54_09990 [Escherichia coli]EFB1596309.1 hypothetical protein [Escherichia coli]EGY1249453.1 hypothetical protein [Escherichia coli]